MLRTGNRRWIDHYNEHKNIFIFPNNLACSHGLYIKMHVKLETGSFTHWSFNMKVRKDQIPYFFNFSVLSENPSILVALNPIILLTSIFETIWRMFRNYLIIEKHKAAKIVLFVINQKNKYFRICKHFCNAPKSWSTPKS